MSSQTIIVGSQSPIKINAIKDAFRSFTVIGVNCNSSVHEQPVGLEETEKGARHRAKCAFDSFKNMNLYYAIGIENGMVSTEMDKLISRHCYHRSFGKKHIMERRN
jgi:non-canonical (house-cleaning) NTP pyrophosphatase